jgi:predicted ATP-grasp superfamily ATP-dependent carboligase
MLANKCTLMKLAGTLKIPVPQTWYADSPAGLPLALEELPYPLVLKPEKSWLFQQGQWCRASVHIAATPLEARQLLTADPAFQAHPFLLQEHVEGHGAGVFALYDSGKPLAFFAHRRLREKPPEGGVSVLSESVDVDPLQEQFARMLLEHAGWHGIAMVEYRVTPDGTPYLMEVNTRFWGSLQLAIDAGVDFPYLLYQLACGKQPDPVQAYKTGIRLRWLLGDLDHLYLVLRDNRYSIAGKLRSVLQFLRPSPFRTRHEVNRWNDLEPFWHELKTYIRDLP